MNWDTLTRSSGVFWSMSEIELWSSEAVFASWRRWGGISGPIMGVLAVTLGLAYVTTLLSWTNHCSEHRNTGHNVLYLNESTRDVCIQIANPHVMYPSYQQDSMVITHDWHCSGVDPSPSTCACKLSFIRQAWYILVCYLTESSSQYQRHPMEWT